MELKKTASKIGSGLLTGLAFAAELPTMTRMTEIETEIDKLQEEYAKLNDKLASDHQRKVPYTS